MSRSHILRIVTAVLIALLGLTITSALGAWQYDRAHRDDIAAEVLAASARPVAALVAPGAYVLESDFGRRALVRGRLHPEQSLVTCGHVQRDVAGCWLLSPVALADGRSAVVVGGFVAENAAQSLLTDVRSRPAREVAIAGRLQPAESMERGTAFVEPADRVHLISTNELVQRWGAPLVDGYVVAFAPLAGERVTTALVLPPSGITWRNLFYAWQWWMFAGFVLFVLWRYISDVRADARALASTPADPEETP